MAKLDVSKVYIQLPGMTTAAVYDLRYRKADQRPYFMLNAAPQSGGFARYNGPAIVAGEGAIAFGGQVIKVTLAEAKPGTDTAGREYTALAGNAAIGTDYAIVVNVREKADGTVSWRVNVTAPRAGNVVAADSGISLL